MRNLRINEPGSGNDTVGPGGRPTAPPRALSPRRLRWLLNLFPPLLFNRIRVVEVARDFRSCRVRVAYSRLSRNLQGTTFGGTMYSAADPFYAVLYWQIFAHRGERVQAWLRSAQARYLRPARSPLTLVFELSEADVERAAAALARDGRHACSHRVEAVDAGGRVCMVADTEVYLRRPRPDQAGLSAF